MELSNETTIIMLIVLLSLMGVLILYILFKLLKRLLYGDLKERYVSFVLGHGSSRKLKSYQPYGLFTKKKLRRKLASGKWVVLGQNDINLLRLANFDVSNIKTYDEVHKVTANVKVKTITKTVIQKQAAPKPVVKKYTTSQLKTKTIDEIKAIIAKEKITGVNLKSPKPILISNIIEFFENK